MKAKIFLIAITFAMVTVLVVYMDTGRHIDKNCYLLLMEKALFIFAITIPFDIRDIDVDRISNVKTIPRYLGIAKSVRIAQFSTAAAMLLVLFNDLYTLNYTLTMLLTYVATIALLQFTDSKREDLFFSFGVDGLMILQTLALFVIWLF